MDPGKVRFRGQRKGRTLAKGGLGAFAFVRLGRFVFACAGPGGFERILFRQVNAGGAIF
jgi:hypothetical protein